MAADSQLDLAELERNKTNECVSESMVCSVLAVCPHLEPDKIRQDLEMTGSVTRTINRVFEGQFLSGFLHHTTVPAQDNNSQLFHTSTVQEISDSDDDDILVGDSFFGKDRKTSFTSLRARFDSISSRTTKHSEANRKASGCLDGKEVDRICEQGKTLDRFSESRPRCLRIRSDTVDLSSSEYELTEVNDVRQKQSVVTSMKSSEDVVIVNDEDHGPPEKVAKLRYNGTGIKISTSSASHREHPVSSEDSDEDIPCMLPSMLRETSTNKSTGHWSNYHSSETQSEEAPEGFRAEAVPKKKKKRSPEEVALARQNALLQREARERERQAKREAKEAEKSEKQQTALLKRLEKEKDKLAKKAHSMTQKTLQRRDCVKHIQVCIDPHLIADVGEENDTSLLQQIVELGASYSIDPQPKACSLTWKRAMVEHSVGDELQISSKTTYIEEDVAAVCILVEQFVEMVFAHKHGIDSFSSGQESFVSFCRNMRRLFPGKSLTIIIIGVEKYFREVKAKQQRQYREQVRGTSTSDNEKSASKGKKKAAKETGSGLVVSRVDVEEALVEQQLKVGCNVYMCETPQELVSCITTTTKAVAEAPYKRTQPDAFSFCTEGSGKGSVKISKDGQGLTKAWQQQLQQLRNVSADMAAAIAAQYPSVQSLVRAYQNCQTDEYAAKLLQDILVRRGTGVLASTRRIGPELSRRIFMLFSSRDGEMLLK